MTKKSMQMPLYEQLLKELKGQIVTGVYKRGDLLPSEKELIDTYGISRITVRKALSILSELGFVETCKGKGSVVLFSQDSIGENRSFSEAVEEFRQKFMHSTQIRLLLEPEVARQAALTATKEQIEHIRACMKGEQKMKCLESFHQAIVSVLSNCELDDIMGEVV